MQHFKKGDRIVCVNDEQSNNKLIKGNTYIVEKTIVMSYDGLLYIVLENLYYEFFADRFINLKDQRKQKLTKINKL